MKKVFLILSILFVFAGSAWADGNRLGAQFSSNGDLGTIYYGKDFGWAAGGSIGYATQDFNQRQIDTGTGLNGRVQNGYNEDYDEFRFNVFARKNFKVRDNTYLGFGVTAQFAYGDAEVEYDIYEAGGLSDVSVEGNSWSVAPYFIVDYHLSKNWILNAGATIVKFKETRWEGEGTLTEGDETFEVDATMGKTTEVSYFDPFFEITYLF